MIDISRLTQYPAKSSYTLLFVQLLMIYLCMYLIFALFIIFNMCNNSYYRL